MDEILETRRFHPEVESGSIDSNAAISVLVPPPPPSGHVFLVFNSFGTSRLAFCLKQRQRKGKRGGMTNQSVVMLFLVYWMWYG